VKLHGRTRINRQRFRCLVCGKTYVWKRTHNKRYRGRHWFELWVKEGYSIRQLISISGHSRAKLDRIKNFWLEKEPPPLSDNILLNAKYVLFDGTYFHKNGCLAIIMDHKAKKPISYVYMDKESYYNVLPMLLEAKDRGLEPKAVTMDGHIQVIRAIQEVWPEAVIQRCLYHIQRQGMSWLRTCPKTEAGMALRKMLISLTDIKTDEDRLAFLEVYNQWNEKYREFIRALPRTSVANIDLKRATALINNALPDMFHYLQDPDIAATTNLLENFYSQLKQSYIDHRGLTETHKISYLKWYCYLKSQKNSNTL
jgi:hypothetical protein